MVLPQLRRVRWAVRATLVLGVAASVVANILHALDNPISQAIAAWPPLALLLTVELISRVPVHRRSLAAARLVATATIAGIAAWVSYWHMAGVAARYGETGASPYLLPLSVDGLIVVASICLVELSGRINAVERQDREGTAATQPVPGLIPVPAATTAPAAAPQVPAVTTTAQTPAVTKAAVPAARTATTAPAVTKTAPVTGRAEGATALRRTTAAALAEVAATLPKAGLPKTRGAETSAFTPVLTRAKAAPARSGPVSPAKPKVRRSPAETVAAAAKIKASRPDLTDAQLAAELGISTSRWRTIRRETGADDDLRLAA
ncbi:DUF2637 domain-containing protein [Actinoplanes sp. NPDC049316]|uniref:DUF2637 domain-containing protein n=1 Tax=Actinoplanes sp. NPDC049316 TaxID=3154727 RepID=UPI00341D80A0